VQAASPEIDHARDYGAKAKITFQVVDTSERPVGRANAMIGFFNQRNPNKGIYGMTDLNGLFEASGTTIGDVNYQFTKDGFYRTQAAYWFDRRNDPTVVKDGCWQPWNPTNRIVLKEKRNPIPMFARKYNMKIPTGSTPTGFDLEKGDWVAPKGAGTQADIYFAYTSTNQGIPNFANYLIMSCSNSLDGFFCYLMDTNSEFVSMYEAPTNGYQTKLTMFYDQSVGKPITKDELWANQYLIFRVRTVADTNGNIVSARYGKIYGPIDMGARDITGKTGLFLFTYYFNSSETRNLEFNPKQNLFTNLPPLESIVYKP
jgi:hypothetical protein